jgi:hypothetical protein
MNDALDIGVGPEKTAEIAAKVEMRRIHAAIITIAHLKSSSPS